MKLHPNPPRMVTVVLAVALGILGVALAWPVAPLVTVLGPITDTVKGFGVTMDQATGFLCLLASSGLLVAGSLLPGI
ncbi:MAG: hypothetical protein WCK58_02345 [Chloroflexota bacterium]